MTPSKDCERTHGWGLFDPRLFPLLEPPETNLPHLAKTDPGVPIGEFSLSEVFRHSGWAHNRGLVYAALRRTNQSVSRIHAFADCGSHAYVFQNLRPPFDFRLGGSSCKDRFCVPCARERSRVLAANVLTALSDKPVRFLTLTLRTNPGSLSAQVDRLYRCFTALRKRAFWRKRVFGGCAFTEVKWSPRHSAWNVHVHCMLHGLYLPKSDLWRAWYSITGDSLIVDIKLVQNKGCIAHYVTKYVSKPFSDSFLNRAPQFDELVRAMLGRRLCITFGDWRGIKLTESPTSGEWLQLGTFHDVVQQAANGDPDSLRAVRSICGDRTDEMLRTLRRARPPPVVPVHQARQLYFQGVASDYE